MGIGPSTKETTLHHFRDPLLKILAADLDIDLLGIIISGTAQDNTEKLFSAERVGAWAEAMRADGAIVSLDGWGNQDIDLVETLRSLGERGIPAVGLKFIGRQAPFVVKNEYVDTVVDYNKSASGRETEVVGENTINEFDAKRAVALLKLKMKRVKK